MWHVAPNLTTRTVGTTVPGLGVPDYVAREKRVRFSRAGTLGLRGRRYPVACHMIYMSMAPAGLLNKKKNTPVPLRSVCVKATVRGYTAGVVSTLEYENQEEEPIEAVFTFPLDASSTVVGFSATIQDRKINGRVEEKQKAQETYDDAIASGQSAFLMASERKDVFTITVGNLPPKEKAEVTVTYVMELSTEHDG